MGFSPGGFAPNFIFVFETPDIFILHLMNLMVAIRQYLSAGKCFGQSVTATVHLRARSIPTDSEGLFKGSFL